MATEDDIVASVLGGGAQAAAAPPAATAGPTPEADIVKAVLSGNPPPAAAPASSAVAASPEATAAFADIGPKPGTNSPDFGLSVRSNLQGAADAVGGLYKSMHDAIVGNAAEPDLGEIPSRIAGKSIEGYGMVGPLMDVARTPEGKFDILKTAFPNATARRDANGHLIASVDGKEFYLNKPGLSMQDINDALAMLTVSLPLTTNAAGAVAAFAGPLGNYLGQAVGAAGGSIGQDLIAGAKGSKQGVDPVAAAVTGLLTPLTAFTVDQVANFARPTVQQGVKAIFAKPGAIDPQAGTLSEETALELRNIGIDPDKLSRDAVRKIGQLIDEGVDAKTIGRSAQQEKLRQATGVAVPLTKGDLTRSPSDQMFESQAGKGAFGKPAEEVMQGNIAAKDAALKQSADAIQGRLSGVSTPTVAPGEGAAGAQQALSQAERTMKSVVDAAYEFARSGGAEVDSSWFRNTLPSRMEQTLQDAGIYRGAGDTAGVDAVFSTIEKIADKASKGDTIPVNALEQVRQAIVKRIDGATGANKAGLLAMKDTIDNETADLVGTSLMRGDEAAIQRFVDARGLHADYSKVFKAGDLIQQLTERTPDGSALKVGADDAVKYIFGRGKLGATEGLEGDIAKLKDLLPADQWNALREEAFMRLMKSQEAGNNRGQDMARLFSGDKFATALDSAMKEAPGAMKALFSSEELDAIHTLKDVALLATNKVKGGENFSNTAAAISNAVQKLWGVLGGVGQVGQATIGRLVNKAIDNWQANNVAAVTKGAASIGGFQALRSSPLVGQLLSAAANEDMRSGGPKKP